MALCRFYEALKNRPRTRTPSHLALPRSPSILQVSGLSLSVPLTRCPRVFSSSSVPQGVETFFVESPLLDKVLCRLGPLMDAHCVGYVVPVCPTTGRLLPREKTRVHLCVNRPPPSRPREAAANSRKGKRNNKFCTLFRGNGLVKYFLPFPPYFVDCSFFSLSFPSVSFLLF